MTLIRLDFDNSKFKRKGNIVICTMALLLPGHTDKSSKDFEHTQRTAVYLKHDQVWVEGADCKSNGNWYGS